MDTTEKRRLLEALTGSGIQVLPIWWIKKSGECACGTSCGSNKGKHPYLGIGWAEKATADMRKVDNWLASFPEVNWGVLTGLRSNIFVVDIDPKNGGVESWKKLTEGKELPPTLEVKTGSGGTHLYFLMPKNDVIKTRVGIVDGVDIKGEGSSQVVAPPSLHQSGNYYEWIVGPADGRRPMDSPEWLLDFIFKEQKKNTHIKASMDGVAKLGTRDDALFANALALLKQGMGPDLVVNAVWSWVEAGGVEQTPQDRIDRAYVEDKVRAANSFMIRGDPRNQDTSGLMLNDEGNAKRLLPRVVGKLLHATGVGWLRWTGTVWRVDPDNKRTTTAVSKLLEEIIREELTTASRQAAGQLGNWLRASLNEGKIVSTMNTLARQDDVRVEAGELDTDPYALNFSNGTLDLRTGDLRSHEQSDMITKQLPFDYDPSATCPTWDSTLDFAFGGNREARVYFLQALGYSLTGDQSRQEIFIPWGEEGNNCKSTLLGAFLRIMGKDYASSLDVGAIEADRYGTVVMSQLAQLRGARFALVAETEAGMVLNEGLIKLVTGGEELVARELYKPSFTYSPQFKVWIVTNNKPVIRSAGEPIWRRIKLIPFELVIPPEQRRDRTDVDAEIYAEAAGVVAQLVKAYLEYRRAKEAKTLVEPAYITSAVREYRDEMDIVTTFIAEEYEDDPAGEATTRSMYEAFVGWCKVNGIRYPMSSISFVRQLRKAKGEAVSEVKTRGTLTVRGVRRRPYVFGSDDTL